MTNGDIFGIVSFDPIVHGVRDCNIKEGDCALYSSRQQDGFGNIL